MPSKDEIILPKGTILPNHIAIILDGNRRWARARGLHTLEGHRAGFEAARKTAKAARKMGVHTLTVWGFSTENWDRSKKEIDYLMTLYWKFVKEVRSDAKKEGVRFIHLGRKDRFPGDLVNFMSQVEEETKNNTRHVFNAALDYGGHDEILRAVKKIVDGKIPSGRINEELFASYLDTHDQPYPYVDLLIRTSGEQRTSGLLPWQMAYSEYYWELDHLPDFTQEKLRKILIDYSRRRRRFGGNDVVEHLKFTPELTAKLELNWWRLRKIPEGVKFRDYAIMHLKEQFGLSKELAKEAAKYMIKAVDDKDSIGEATEVEDTARELYAEVYRISLFQAAKAAHLRVLAAVERNLAERGYGDEHWDKAEDYLQKFYSALKERVA